jgi:hypothetical protein
MKLKTLTSNIATTVAILTLLASATPKAVADVIYQTGFEPPTFSVGTLNGQNGWSVSGASTSQTVVETSVVRNGLQAVGITPSGANGVVVGAVRYVSYNAANQILTFGNDAFLSATGTKNFWTAIDTDFYPNSHPNIDINIDGSGLIHVFIMGTDHPSGVYVTRGVWNHYELDVNFINNTVSAFYNSTVLVQNVSFSSSSTTLGIYAFYAQPSATTDAGYFDNFSVTTSGSSTPATFTPTDIATLNGTQENSITLLTSANLSGSFPYLAADGGSAGQNMITVVGLVNSANQWVGGAPQVVYNGVPSQGGSSGTASWSNLTVPSSSGTCQLWFQSYLTTSTSAAISSFETSPPTVSGYLSGIVATVIVGNPPSFTPTTMATLNGTQENSITLAPAANLSGGFPYLAADGGSPGQNMITVIGLVNNANQWVGGTPQIVYNGVPSQAGSSGTASWSNLAVPPSPGTYQLWFQSFLTTSTSVIYSFEESPPTASGNLAGIIATVTAQGPTVITGSASSITANSATLNGSVNPNGLATTYYFQYGTSTAYGQTVTPSLNSAGSGTTALNVYSPTVLNLVPNTTYHFRLVASSSAGTTPGGDQYFTTPSGGSPASAANSSLTAAPPSAPADGTSQITATVTLRDGNNNPVAGKSVQFYALEINSGGTPVAGSLQFHGSVNPTDVNGQATAAITANTPGTVTITVKDTTDNISVSQPATVTFSPTLQTPVPPNADLQSAIQSLYQVSAKILNGTPTSGLDLTNIVTDEGAMAHYFYIAAGQDAVQAFADAVVFGVTALTDTEGLSFLQKLAIQEGLTIENVSLDQQLSELVKHELSGNGVLVTRAQNVASACNSFQQEMQFIELTILSGVPMGVNNNSSVYVNDFNSRQQANQVLQQYAQQVHDYFSALQTASQNAANGNISTTLIANSTVTAGTTILDEQTEDTAPEAGAAIGALPAAINIWQEYQNENQNMDAHIALGFNIAAVGGVAADISNNVNAAFAELTQQQTPNPITGQVVDARVNYSYTSSTSQGDISGWMPSHTINPTVNLVTSATADVTLKNTMSSDSATFFVYAEYSFDGSFFGINGYVPAASVAWVTIPAGQTSEFQWTLFDGNNGAIPSSSGSIVTFDAIGANSSGMFYIGSSVNVGPLALQHKAADGSPKPLDGGSSNSVIYIENPIRCYVNQNPSNQTYQAHIWIENPFVVPLTATVTQVIPDGIMVSDLSTNGTLQGSSIVWTNCIASSNSVGNSFTFSLSVTPGVQTNLPPSTVVFSDTNGNSLSLQGVAPNFNGLFPVQVGSLIPVGVLGVDSTMLVAVTNLTGTSQSGSLTVTLTDSSGNPVTNVLESFSLDGSDGTNLSFTLPGSLSAGSYSLTGSLSINGGTGQVLAGNYVVPAPPVALNLGSSPALTTNGLNMALQGPTGNYLIEASSDLSSPTNWRPIAFYSSTNASFYYNFSVPMATNANQQFYRAVMQ